MKKWSTFGHVLKMAFKRRNVALLVNLAGYYGTMHIRVCVERSIKKYDKLAITSVGSLSESWPICFLEGF